MSAEKFTVFSQELYFDESMIAIDVLRQPDKHEHPLSKIADLLRQPSPSTRTRIASKIMQRISFLNYSRTANTPFVDLVSGLKNESAKRDLIYWKAARTDRIISSIAEEIFYPYFIMNRLPSGYSESMFNMANTGTLLDTDRIISRDIVVDYAQRTWNFDSTRTLTLALRIMHQAEILDTVIVKVGNRHILGYYPQPHPAKLEVFAYCMFEEYFLGASSMISIDQIHNGECGRLFLQNRLQIDSMLKTMEQRKLIQNTNQRGGRYISFIPPDLKSLVSMLLEK